MKKELVVDMRTSSLSDTLPEMKRCNTLCQKINICEPYTEEYQTLLKELFDNNLDESVFIVAPLHIDLAKNLTIGKNVYINHDFDCMARGNVIIEEDVMIGPNVSILTANHDLLDHQILRCK
ncbi:MAG: sugar O-acetyltransferase, partial [Bacilli bacterium]|nr:sugar O-acetyltransferase [Bacilli bacterium]